MKEKIIKKLGGYTKEEYDAKPAKVKYRVRPPTPEEIWGELFHGIDDERNLAVVNRFINDRLGTVDLDEMCEGFSQLHKSQRDAFRVQLQDLKDYPVFEWVEKELTKKIMEKVFLSRTEDELRVNKVALWVQGMRKELIKMLLTESKQYKPKK